MTEQLKALAEAATQGPWTLSDGVVIPVADLGLPWIKVRWIVDTRVYLKSDAAYIAAANPERILALIAENERLRGVLDEIATINSLTATQPQFIRYLQNTAQAALCHGKDPDSCWNTRCNLGHKCRSALGETK